MKRFNLTIVYLISFSILCISCGGGGGGGTSGLTPTASVQLAGIESDFIDGANRNSTTILYINPAGDTFEQWTADSTNHYFYDEQGTLIQEDIAYNGLTSLDSVFYIYDAKGQLSSKRYERMNANGVGQLYLTVNYAYNAEGYIESESHIVPYTTDADGNILHQDTLLATITYLYAYKDAS